MPSQRVSQEEEENKGIFQNFNIESILLVGLLLRGLNITQRLILMSSA